ALYSLELGFDPAPLLTMRLNLPDRKYPTPEVRRAFYDQLDARLQGMASLQAGTVVNSLPLNGGGLRQIQIDGHDAPANAAQIPSATLLYVGSRYWDTLGLKLAKGRPFDSTDGLPGHENAIINQRFAAMHFGTEDPVGRRVKLTIETGPGQPPPPFQP